jgi:hypothetical protein
VTSRLLHNTQIFRENVLLTFKLHNMDFDEADTPPMLVDVQAIQEENLEDSKPVKVPITIVTGKHFCASS